MKASKFHGSARQAFVLKQGEEGTPVAEICRKAGISQATYFNWSEEDQQTVRWTVCPTNAVWWPAA